MKPLLHAGVGLLSEDLILAARWQYKILDKTPALVPLLFNSAQKHVHNQIELQRARKRWVRALVLKGRQQGISTYIAARFYHRVTYSIGVHAYIMAHEDKATANLFRMVKRFHDHNPGAPTTSATNAQELIFADLMGGYRLATAGSRHTGRSATVQLLHGSEVAFWTGLSEHLSGIGNTVPDAPGTEIILETTANGEGTPFHQLWLAAVRGENEFIPIFVPWYWQREYRRSADGEVALTEEELDYKAAYRLDDEQMLWRRWKIASYGPGNEWLFDQEYPATPELAFRTATRHPFVSPLLVSAAVASTIVPEFSMYPVIVGVDPAEFGRDRTAIVFRCGRVAYRTEVYRGKSTMEVVGILGEIFREKRPTLFVIDRTGIGAGVVDRCVELGLPVVGVHSGAKANRSELFHDKKAEMWSAMRDWLEDTPVRIINDLALIADISSPSYTMDSTSRLWIERKQDMRARGVNSPDLGDALALTFAVPVQLPSHAEDILPGIHRLNAPSVGRSGY